MADSERAKASSVPVLTNPIRSVELMFKAVDEDLDDIAAKLDREFCRDIRREDQLSSTDNMKMHRQEMINPVTLLRRIQQIRTEFASMVQSIAVIREAEKEAMQFMLTQMITSCAGLARLQADTGVVSSSEQPEALKRFQLLLESGHSTQGGETSTDLNHGSSIHLGSSSKSAFSSLEEEETASSRGEIRPPVRIASIRSGNEFQPIHQHQFDTVSILVRGRLKLEDVNITYTKLWHYFKEAKNSKPLTAVDMDRMGFRVSGKTGFAKLKILQILKMIQLSSKGDVLKLLV